MEGGHRFASHPRPNDEVIQRLESALAAARKGQVPTVAIVVITPTQEPEITFAGDLGNIRGNALLGAIGRAFHQLVQRL